MTELEAQKILELLQEGKEFGTRFRTDDWGIKYLTGDKYEKWTRVVDVFTNDQGKKDLCQNYVTKEISAEMLSELLCKYYNYNDVISKIKD